MTDADRPCDDPVTDLEFLDCLERIASIAGVVDAIQARLRAIGVPRGRYHFTPPFHSQTGERVVIFHHGYPPEAVARYNDPAVRAQDPLPDIVMAAMRPMTRREALAVAQAEGKPLPLEPLARVAGLEEQVGVPLFGPGGRDAYSAFDLMRPFTPDDRPLLRRYQQIAQTGHLRISHLVIEELNGGAALSMREAEVLSWVVAGKSGNDIATILAISPATVDTYLRRIYAKLKVNDRVKAALLALSLGLVKL